MILLPYLLFFFYVHNVSFVSTPLSPSCEEGVLNPLPSPRPFQKGKGCNRPRCSEPLRSKVGGASKPSPWLCGMGPLGCYGDQRLRPLPNNSECEPKRTNSIALLFLSNQIKSVSFSIWHSI